MVIVHGMKQPYWCWQCKFNELLTLDSGVDRCCIVGVTKLTDKDGNMAPPACHLKGNTPEGEDFRVDMPMPSGCVYCKLFAEGSTYYCRATGRQVQLNNIRFETRPHWCPLEEVSE